MSYVQAMKCQIKSLTFKLFGVNKSLFTRKFLHIELHFKFSKQTKDETFAEIMNAFWKIVFITFK